MTALEAFNSQYFRVAPGINSNSNSDASSLVQDLGQGLRAKCVIVLMIVNGVETMIVFVDDSVLVGKGI